MNSPIHPEAVKKIGVLRANAVGDYIVALPALEALRSLYRHAEIVLLGRHWHADFLSGRPGPVDRTIVVPYSRGIYDPPDQREENPDDLKNFFQKMNKEHFDLVFQFHGGGKNSNPFVRSLGAGMTIGARTPEALPLDRWIPYRAYQNETLRLLEIVSLVGASPSGLGPRIEITNNDLSEAAEHIPGDGRPIVVINPGSRDPRRRWPPHKFAVVADAFADRGARIIVNGVSQENQAVQDMLSWMRSPAESICGSLSLNGLAGLLSRSRLLISNDSGPYHLANAVGTPSVGLYWCGNVPTFGPVFTSRTSVHVSWRMHCPVCGVHCMQDGCAHRDSFVAEIPAQEVIASSFELYYAERHGQ